MTSHFLDDVLDAKPRPVPQEAPVAVQGWRAIPPGCDCTWCPSYATLPATWRRTKANPHCKVHGAEPAAEGTGGRA